MINDIYDEIMFELNLEKMVGRPYKINRKWLKEKCKFLGLNYWKTLAEIKQEIIEDGHNYELI
jgi:hypothetical protein